MAPSVEPRVIENEHWQVGVLPEVGMSTAFGRIRTGGSFVDFMRNTPASSYGRASDCASFLLIPWSNRLKGARFSFRGKEYQLRPNAGDGTAIHGVARDFPWSLERSEEMVVAGTFDSRKHSDVNFPFPFCARVEFRLEGPKLVSTIRVTNVGSEPMPAGFGHHPYFQRALTGPEDTAMLQIPCDQSYELESAIPKGPPGPVAPRLDFRTMRGLPSEHVDDVLTGRRPGEPIRIRYPKTGVEIAMRCDPSFEHIVLYVPSGKTYFAVEPVTNTNDGFNLFARGVGGTGVFVLSPGEEKTASIELSFRTT